MVLGFSLLAALFLVTLFIMVLALIALGVIVTTLSPNPEKINVPTILTWLSNQARQLLLLTKPPFQDDTLNHDIVKKYSWIFPVRNEVQQRLPPARFSLKLSISQPRYNQYRQQPRRELNPYRFDTYVTLSMPEVKLLANKLLQLGQNQGYHAYDQLCFTLAFIQQSIRYAHDRSPKTGRIIEYPKYPLETLMDERGDCEDQAILLAALLKLMGYEVALLVLPTHVALGVAGFHNLEGAYTIDPTTGARYFYIETTVNGWLPGEVPKEFQADLARGSYDVLPIATPETN
jgi:transglutaminase-like putative cysteine protease